MCGPEDPLFTPLLPLARVPFQAKESVHTTPFWENLEILASTATISTQILAHKPPNLEIFCSQAPKFEKFSLTSPPFQRQMSVRKPHTSEIRAAHPYLKKKLSAPPPGYRLIVKVTRRLTLIKSSVMSSECSYKNNVRYSSEVYGPTVTETHCEQRPSK